MNVDQRQTTEPRAFLSPSSRCIRSPGTSPFRPTRSKPRPDISSRKSGSMLHSRFTRLPPLHHNQLARSASNQSRPTRDLVTILPPVANSHEHRTLFKPSTIATLAPITDTDEPQLHDRSSPLSHTSLIHTLCDRPNPSSRVGLVVAVSRCPSLQTPAHCRSANAFNLRFAPLP